MKELRIVHLDFMEILLKLNRDAVYVHIWCFLIWKWTCAFSSGWHLEWRIKIFALLKCVSDWSTYVTIYSLLLLDAPGMGLLKLWKQLILQRFSTLILVNKCTVAFNKIGYGCKTSTRINFQALIPKLSPAPYPTRLKLLDSAPATL